MTISARVSALVECIDAQLSRDYMKNKNVTPQMLLLHYCFKTFQRSARTGNWNAVGIEQKRYRS